MDVNNFNSVVNEWNDFLKEKNNPEEIFKTYQSSLSTAINHQRNCFKEINHEKYRLDMIKDAITKTKVNLAEEKEKREEIINEISKRFEHLKGIEQELSPSRGKYLKVILGDINVKIATSEEKFKYKEQYETFKLTVTVVVILVAILDLVFYYRAIDAILHFLLVWYHCTLTIRESILIANGSRIKGWWRFVQFFTTVKAGIMILWPDGLIYDLFRRQFVLYILYTSLLQCLQFYYQQGCLYRLRALGERYDMDITISGFHSWMWRGLTFLLPFLYIGYLFQLYNSITLYKLSHHEQCDEWQVPVVSFIFFCLFLGNSITAFLVIRQKLKEKRD